MKLPTLCGRKWAIFSLCSTYKKKICPLKTDIGAHEMGTGSIRSLYRNAVLFVHCLVWKENFLLKLVAKLRNEADTFLYRCEKTPLDCNSLCPLFVKKASTLAFQSKFICWILKYVGDIRFAGIPLWDGNRRTSPNLITKDHNFLDKWEAFKCFLKPILIWP